ncbi:hypothetical protein PVAP13_9NG529842 [Panicum virgatum]|uniref:Uncharacterized protein n=1 Tax=Panicum virgatum TaxID=38727 RepID=A0A8T0MYN8_PANVG|nr:hypothetical protein PVAP13_9NG529842 [Panicum virgatum]
MIERVTKVTFQKTCKHEPFHLRARSGDTPPLPPLHAGATRNPRLDPTPSSSRGTSSSRHGHHDSFVKRALRSLFGMCRNIAHDVHDNTRSINEIRGHLGLPLNAHHDLPEFDDPFAEWDAADEAAIAAAHAPLPRARRQACSPRRRATTSSSRAPPSGQEIFDEDEKTEEEEPQGYHDHRDSDEDEDTSEDAAQDDDEYKTFVLLFISFLAFDDKGGVKMPFMYSFGHVSTYCTLWSFRSISNSRIVCKDYVA